MSQRKGCIDPDAGISPCQNTMRLQIGIAMQFNGASYIVKLHVQSYVNRCQKGISCTLFSDSKLQITYSIFYIIHRCKIVTATVLFVNLTSA